MDIKFQSYRSSEINCIEDEATDILYQTPVKYTTPFQSFWMGGFECTDKLNAFGNRVDLINTTGHLQLIEEDYKRLSLFKIGTVREGIRWSYVEKKPYHYDWSVVEKMIIAGRKNNIQQVWDMCHFGFPDDLTPLHPMFARRFASLCKSFVHFLSKYRCSKRINNNAD